MLEQVELAYNVEGEGDKGGREVGNEIRKVEMESKANFGVEEAAVYLLCIPLQNTQS